MSLCRTAALIILLSGTDGSSSYWIGGQCTSAIFGPTYCISANTSQSITWVNGVTGITYQNWAPDEPNAVSVDKGGCIEMHGRTGKWNDAACDNSLHCICQCGTPR